MSEEKIRKHVEKRLKAVQDKYNFNLKLGAAQVKEAPPKVREVYEAFKELMAIAKLLKLPVPYSVLGNNTYNSNLIEETPTYVYLCQRKGTTEWKVGYSKSPQNRKQALSTGNSGTLIIRARVVGGRDFEQTLLQYLKPLKIPGRVKEWFYLTEDLAKEVVKKLPQGIEAFQGVLVTQDFTIKSLLSEKP